MQRQAMENEELTVSELRDALKSKKTAFVFLCVNITPDKKQHVNISISTALNMIAGRDGSIKTTAIMAGCDIIIG